MTTDPILETLQEALRELEQQERFPDTPKITEAIDGIHKGMILRKQKIQQHQPALT